MKNFRTRRAKVLLLIIVLGALVVFPVAAGGSSDSSKGDENITVTVTGTHDQFSDYVGWKAWMAVGDDTYAMPLNVDASTASLTFTILRKDNDKPFTKAGNYMVIFWFRENDDKSTDKDFVIMGKQIKKGDNSIEFSSFSEL